MSSLAPGCAAHLVCATLLQIPLGVYWPGETTYNDQPDRWARVDATFQSLRQHAINTVWMNNLPASELAQFAQRARRQRLRLIPAVNNLEGSVEWIRTNPDGAAQIEEAVADWGRAPPPLSWAIADEPRAAYLDQMLAYESLWRSVLPQGPLSVVVPWGNDLEAAAALQLEQRATDVYPFFLPGAPGYPTTPANAYRQIQRRNVQLGGAVPWGMFQTFSAPDLTYAWPTPEQVTWQAWAALAEGADGLFAFALRPLPGWMALLDDADEPTPQYEQLGAAFRQIAAQGSLWTETAPDPTTYVGIVAQPGQTGVARILAGNRDQQKYLLLVAGYDVPGSWTMTVQFGPEVLNRQLSARVQRSTSEIPFGLRTLTVSLPAGTGQLFPLQIDAAQPVAYYRDEFETTQFLTDAVAATGIQRVPDALHHYVLTAANAAAWPGCSLDYDLDQRLGPRDASTLRMLMYNGWGQPADARGVRVYQSDDRRTWTLLSQNQFERPCPVTQRYVRFSIAVTNSAGAPYGFLSEWSVWSWSETP